MEKLELATKMRMLAVFATLVLVYLHGCAGRPIPYPVEEGVMTDTVAIAGLPVQQRVSDIITGLFSRGNIFTTPGGMAEQDLPMEEDQSILEMDATAIGSGSRSEGPAAEDTFMDGATPSGVVEQYLIMEIDQSTQAPDATATVPSDGPTQAPDATATVPSDGPTQAPDATATVPSDGPTQAPDATATVPSNGPTMVDTVADDFILTAADAPNDMVQHDEMADLDIVNEAMAEMEDLDTHLRQSRSARNRHTRRQNRRKSSSRTSEEQDEKSDGWSMNERNVNVEKIAAAEETENTGTNFQPKDMGVDIHIKLSHMAEGFKMERKQRPSSPEEKVIEDSSREDDEERALDEDSITLESKKELSKKEDLDREDVEEKPYEEDSKALKSRKKLSPSFEGLKKAWKQGRKSEDLVREDAKTRKRQQFRVRKGQEKLPQRSVPLHTQEMIKERFDHLKRLRAGSSVSHSPLENTASEQLQEDVQPSGDPAAAPPHSIPVDSVPMTSFVGYLNMLERTVLKGRFSEELKAVRSFLTKAERGEGCDDNSEDMDDDVSDEGATGFAEKKGRVRKPRRRRREAVAEKRLAMFDTENAFDDGPWKPSHSRRNHHASWNDNYRYNSLGDAETTDDDYEADHEDEADSYEDEAGRKFVNHFRMRRSENPVEEDTAFVREPPGVSPLTFSPAAHYI